MKILFLSAEVAPFVKVGGLADVAGALPKALKKEGIDIRLVLPKYGAIDDKKFPAKLIAKDIKIDFEGKKETIQIYETRLPGSDVPVYLIDHLLCFGSGGVYLEGVNKGEGVTDEARRFGFFSKSALDILPVLEFCPDVIHFNDWHVGLGATLLNVYKKQKIFYKKIKSVLTIHNLAYQGIFQKEAMANLLGISPADFLSIGDKVNCLKEAILGVDIVNTVSPSYAEEILTAEYGAGLEGDLAGRKKDLYGILNGIDMEVFDPQTDPHIKNHYSADTLNLKQKNKTDLQGILGLPKDDRVPLLTFVGRLMEQKGLDILNPLLDKLGGMNMQLALLASGDKKYEEEIKTAVAKYPRKISVVFKFDAALAQEIYAGGDIFIVPSRFEPCGLTPMIAMRYGNIPLVRRTGGMKDSVINFDGSNIKTANGFAFEKYDSGELLVALERAIEIYNNDKKVWERLINNAMSVYFGWAKFAKEYIKLYKKLAR